MGSYDDWKTEIEKTVKLRCQWGIDMHAGCENFATCKAHVVGERTFYNNTNKGETRDLNDIPQMVDVSDAKHQRDCNVVIGITCPECDGKLRANEDNKRDFIPITLWKVAAAAYVEDHTESAFATKPLTLLNSRGPTKSEIAMVKQRTRGYLDNEAKWLFTTVDIKEQYLKMSKAEKKETKESIINLGLTWNPSVINGNPQALGRGFTSHKDYSYMYFNIYSRFYTVSSCEINHLSKRLITYNAIKGLMEEPINVMIPKAPNNRNSVLWKGIDFSKIDFNKHK